MSLPMGVTDRATDGPFDAQVIRDERIDIAGADVVAMARAWRHVEGFSVCELDRLDDDEELDEALETALSLVEELGSLGFRVTRALGGQG